VVGKLFHKPPTTQKPSRPSISTANTLDPCGKERNPTLTLHTRFSKHTHWLTEVDGTTPETIATPLPIKAVKALQAARLCLPTSKQCNQAFTADMARVILLTPAAW
jgi:hypothetical protein